MDQIVNLAMFTMGRTVTQSCCRLRAAVWDLWRAATRIVRWRRPVGRLKYADKKSDRVVIARAVGCRFWRTIYNALRILRGDLKVAFSE